MYNLIAKEILMINVKVEKFDDLYNGKPTGKVVWHVWETNPKSGCLKGCPLGRGESEYEALKDFCRRANEDMNEVQLTPQLLLIVSRWDFTTIIDIDLDVCPIPDLPTPGPRVNVPIKKARA
jgi:hypothetical protein